jgi:hypothetical protein
MTEISKPSDFETSHSEFDVTDIRNLSSIGQQTAEVLNKKLPFQLGIRKDEPQEKYAVIKVIFVSNFLSRMNWREKEEAKLRNIGSRSSSQPINKKMQEESELGRKNCS